MSVSHELLLAFIFACRDVIMSPSLTNLQVFISSWGGSTGITVTTSILQVLPTRRIKSFTWVPEKNLQPGKDLIWRGWGSSIARHETSILWPYHIRHSVQTATWCEFKIFSWCLLPGCLLFLLHLGQQLVPSYLILHSSYLLPLFFLWPLLCILYKLALVCVSSVGTGV